MSLSKVLPIFILCTLISFACLGQKYLLLNTENIKKRQYYYPGQFITFSSTFSDKVQKRQITKLDRNKIFFGDDQYKLADIEVIYVTRKGAAIFSNVFLIAGIGYFGLDAINSANNNLKPVIDGTVLRSSIILTAAGLALKPFQTYKIEIPREAKLNIVQVTSE